MHRPPALHSQRLLIVRPCPPRPQLRCLTAIECQAFVNCISAADLLAVICPPDSCCIAYREGSTAAVVINPAKGLMARDLALVCHYERLPLVARPGLGVASRPSINALAAAFVEGLQSNVPSAVSTIQRTAARLQVRGRRTMQCSVVSKT